MQRAYVVTGGGRSLVGWVNNAKEVAAAVDHLLSADASFVTGVVVPVDGGRAALGHDPRRAR
ncbi:MAG: hypothetical protein ACRDK8_05645 [Solirubrobacteraceae bacterium]